MPVGGTIGASTKTPLPPLSWRRCGRKREKKGKEMSIIMSLTPAAFLAQVHKQAAQSPRHIPTALMDGAAEIVRAWIADSGYSMDCAVDDMAVDVTGDAAYIAGWAVSHYMDCPPEYAGILDAARQFGADCVAAGYGAAYAERNFGAVIAYAATGANQVVVTS